MIYIFNMFITSFISRINLHYNVIETNITIDVAAVVAHANGNDTLTYH